jgi:hypothetical protein
MLPISKINAVKFKFPCALSEMWHSIDKRALWNFKKLSMKNVNLLLLVAFKVLRVVVIF